MYPLGEHERDQIRSKTGKSLDEITLQAVVDGRVTSEDIKISSDMLQKQAEIARSANKSQLSENFLRASEMVSIPDDVLLDMYNKLRPNRATKQELLAMARRLLEDFNAKNCAALVFEAAEIYEKRGVLL